jgi:hypothetical protein
MKTWMWFVLMTIVCWGAYVPAIHLGQAAIRESGAKNAGLWGLLIIGLAYFLVAVIAPVAILGAQQSLTPMPSGKGFSIALLAGALGAIGALGVILAVMNANPIVVPPLVFSGAPIVATIVGMLLHKPDKPIEWQFFAGILLAAAGAAMVLRYKPS